MEPTTREDRPPELSISPETIFFIIVKAREFDAKDPVSEPDPGSNASDDHMISVLEDHGDDASQEELTSLIDSLSVDEQVDLVTLAWLGRGEYSLGDWSEVRAEATAAHNDRTAAYLLGMPLLPDYLEEGVAMLGVSLEDYEMEHL